MKSPIKYFLLFPTLILLLSACTKTDANLEKAEKFESKTQYFKAEEVYTEGLKSDPNNPIYLWRRAYNYILTGEIDKAISYCEKRLKQNPDDSNALLLKARCYDILGYQEKPTNLYKKVLNTTPEQKTLEQKLLLSFALNRLGKKNEEETILNSILDECRPPSSAHEFSIKGNVLSRLGRFTEARKTLEYGLKVCPSATKLHLDLGAIYCYQRNHKKCLKHTNTAINMNYDLLRGNVIKGYSYYYNGNYKQAIKYFNEALKQQPNYLSLKYSKLLSFAHLKQLDKAKEEMKAILSFEPGNTWATTHMSTAYNIARDKEKAVVILKTKLDSMPGNAVLQTALANAYIQEERNSEAREILDSALKTNPNNADAYYCRARVNYITRNNDEALADIEKAININKSVACYYCLQAHIFKALNKQEEALSSARKYSEFNPWDESVKSEFSIQ